MRLPTWMGGVGRTDEEENLMEQPQSPWRPTEPDQETRQQLNPWGSPPAEPVDPRTLETVEYRAAAAIERARTTQPAEDSPAAVLYNQGDSWPEGGAHAEPEQDPADPIVDSGVHLGLAGAVESARKQNDDDAERCTHCGGRMPTDHELLTEVLGWLRPAGREAMHRFYVHLFELAPDLRPLFPEKIDEQEEKLLTGIVALLSLFKAGDREMEQLNSELARFGRSHIRFDPPATIEEYAVVKRTFFDVVGDMLGDKLTSLHVAALVRAYEYTAGMMLAAQATARLKGVGRRRRTV